MYGGYCYLNNIALAAAYLCEHGKVAILDVDYHHGNGTQSIFYDSDAVLFTSIHADPTYAYPFYSGFTDETGAGRGTGLNWNLPLPAGTDGETYFGVLNRALERILTFAPAFLLVSLGVDTYEQDPLGSFRLSVGDFGTMGRYMADADLPTLFVQEGGYHLGQIGTCVMEVLRGFGSRVQPGPSR